jgi:YD repeat-containing protein
MRRSAAPLGVTTCTSGDLGRIRAALDGRGVTITYDYDERDRMVKVDSSSSLTVTYDYDGDGDGSVPASSECTSSAAWAAPSPKKAREGEVHAWWRRPDRSWRSV